MLVTMCTGCSGCQSDETIASTSAAGGAAGSTGIGGFTSLGGFGGMGGGGGFVGFCDGSGPPIELDILGGCTGDVASSVFLFAICSCSDIKLQNSLQTDSFDSSQGPDVKHNGSVGLNGAMHVVTQTDIDGSLWSKGNVTWQASVDARSYMVCGGDLTVPVSSTVHSDLFVDGNVEGYNGALKVAGALHITPGMSHSGVFPKGGIIEEAVVVPTPCDCGAPLDIPTIVAGFETSNENDEENIDPTVLSGNLEAVDLVLPCGRYYFTDVTPLAKVNITLEARTAIFVAGDFNPTDLFSIKFGPDAELDLFIAGNLTIKGSTTLGDPARPALSRVYVHGKGEVTSTTDLAANLYLPNETLELKGTTTVWGSLFVGGLLVTSPLTVHYDEAIMDIDGCGDPGGFCEDCHDCGNPVPACVEGTCVPCVQDADCCPPLECRPDGTCRLASPK